MHLSAAPSHHPHPGLAEQAAQVEAVLQAVLVAGHAFTVTANPSVLPLHLASSSEMSRHLLVFLHQPQPLLLAQFLHLPKLEHLAAGHKADVPAYVADFVVLQTPAAAAVSVPVTHSAEQAKATHKRSVRGGCQTGWCVTLERPNRQLLGKT